ncbi:bifunctional aminoglycoside phosphotransferase/ATP-binding protein [Methylovirgula sp. 4M-Z18]|uniref:bifunctional aminoglycoside phosphotransferase/ATP-binding protein n=1 Tax=Methylovirgula sp. 4M-Z18 TaxID=2293567 RepID=UPI000E2E7C77|nr:bifunctional aminoglycoside phosphotransferase/ATP-binding protein [Methylovirgula sp. 4M-Z18]RFB76451.1 aminoglycoside phosphotransferase [Methylovirgula sp. 4M-Z18]
MSGTSGVLETSDHQYEVFAFLGNAATFGLVAPVRRIDTHGAIVFLAGANAYKVKRAVRFPFMDFSTLEKRRVACEAEIEVNKLNAPNIYLDVVPIVRTHCGLALGGVGEIVEWAVHMRRFDEDATLDRFADRDELSTHILTRLVEAILLSHERAPRRDGERAFKALARYLDQNEMAFSEMPNLFDSARMQTLEASARARLEASKDLLLARGRSGYVRRCHGDLHLRNIVLINNEPILFDAVEFDDDIATGDILYDLSFLLMDLEERQLRPAANLVLNRYLWQSDEAHLSGLAALPIFLSLRSAIRAKVIAAGLPHLRREHRDSAQIDARRYFAFAEELLKEVPAQLVAVGGLSGTGKSALSSRVAPCLGRAPGAVWLRSDIERKHMFGVDETDHLPQDAYRKSVDQEVYTRLRRKAMLALKSGQSVIVDAVHSTQGERDGVASIATELNVPFAGLWLEAPLQTRLERVMNRAMDASDANVAVATTQTNDAVNRMTWHRVDASGDLEAVTKAATATLEYSVRPLLVSKDADSVGI